MLKFANPEYFNLYWVLPVLIGFYIWANHHRKELLKRLGDENLISQLTNTISRTKRNWKTALLLIGYVVLVFALTAPQIGTKLEEVKREGVDVFIALDVSKSMLAEDVKPNRFQKAKHEISKFVDRLHV